MHLKQHTVSKIVFTVLIVFKNFVIPSSSTCYLQGTWQLASPAPKSVGEFARGLAPMLRYLLQVQ